MECLNCKKSAKISKKCNYKMCKTCCLNLNKSCNFNGHNNQRMKELKNKANVVNEKIKRIFKKKK